MTWTAGDPAQHWATAIIETAPGVIRLRGYPIEEVIGNLGYVETVWLMVNGELPTPWQHRLLEAALVAGVDHGPAAPSIAAARMAATCGIGLSQAMASGMNLLGDIHGGAGEACMGLLVQIADGDTDKTLDARARQALEHLRTQQHYVPGFGHRMHGHDPRRDPLMQLLTAATEDRAISGRFLQAAGAVERALNAEGHEVPMNIDGATATVYCELGLLPPLGKGLFALSRAVGLLAHAWEQSQRGERIKGPLPPGTRARYIGPTLRPLPRTTRRLP